MAPNPGDNSPKTPPPSSANDGVLAVNARPNRSSMKRLDDIWMTKVIRLVDA